MREIIRHGQFKRDVKRIVKQGKNIQKLKCVMTALAGDQRLPEKYKDHVLKGNWKGRRECHIEPDWLLIYELGRDEVVFERTGSHSELFE